MTPTDEERACDLGSATVVVHYRKGTVRVLSPAAARKWRADRGSTAVVTGHRWEPSWGVQELPMGFSELPRVPARYRMAAAVALPVSLAVMRAGPRSARMGRMVRLVRALHGGGRTATLSEAENAVHAVRALGLFSPVRVACLEESVAATLALAVLGRGVRWCHGVIADPIRLHAWIEAEGHPVAEPDSTRRCTALLTIPTVEETT
ncbi:lasso peptide biosynthesis B2 protein [Nocardiopsis dassonvillei subsp. albirubida]|uniref:Lasso peptide biosynthesis B2 protein n=2 Tax=Nocardiopsis alborubida TaxID=146802 RepID=A0A7X6RNI6_9ACTN|nr:lasso peptide biosynthesis B2 protein [Nocardiopsis alborubida]